jgi:hypothetical protein
MIEAMGQNVEDVKTSHEVDDDEEEDDEDDKYNTKLDKLTDDNEIEYKCH